MVSYVDYAQEVVDTSLREWFQLQTWRNVFATHWEEVAELILPTSRNTFFHGSWNFPGQKKTDRQVDSTGALALMRFVSILDSLLTPRNMTWHGLQASDDYVMKDRATRLWFEQVTRILFKYRYHPMANFSANNCNHWESLGAFGNGSLMIDAYEGDDGQQGLRYLELPLGEMYWRENHQKQIDGFIRHFRLTAQQAIQMFGPEAVGDVMKQRAAQNDQMPLEFMHRVCPRTDYDPGRYDLKGKRYASYYISLLDRKLLREGGYVSFPISASRYVQTPNEVYGRSPAMMVLPALKTLNAEKKDYLTQGHFAARPPWLTTDDGIVDFTMRPGAMNKGGLDENGNELVKALKGGELQVTKEMMDTEAGLIDGFFLTDLFKVLLGDPKIFTATQIVEMMSQRGILIAPIVGRQQSEYLGSMIPRELDVLSQLRLKNGQPVIPPMPPRLREADGEYHVTYSSPLARDMRAQEVAGFNRVLETATNVANVTRDPSIFDVFDFDTALPDQAEIQSVPETWMASAEKIAAKRQRRAQMQERQQQVMEKPANAAMTKANAVAAKAGLPQQQGQGQ